MLAGGHVDPGGLVHWRRIDEGWPIMMWAMGGVVIGLSVGLVAFWGWARRGYRDAHDVDVLVVGGGAAGLTASGMAARLGARALLVESARLGGDCTWYGCVPSKALLATASVVHQARTADAYGLGTAELEVDLAAVLDRVRGLQEEIYEDADSPEVMGGYGVTCASGRVRFLDPHRAEIAGDDGETREVSFRWCVVATGSEPAMPDIEGLADAAPSTNETLFGLEVLPRRLVVLGGGPIGCEMSQAFARLGSEVTLLQRGTHLLPRDPPELVAHLTSALKREGVDVRCDAEVVRVRRRDDGARALDLADGTVVVGDALLVATGRVPRLEGLGLDAAGVKTSPAGIVVDARGRTNVAHIFATGDVAVGPKFTHWAEHASKVAITNTVLGVPSRLQPESLVWTTYTDPEVAHCGLGFDALPDDADTYRLPYSKIDRALTERREEGMIHVYARRGRILGASAVGHLAGEVVAELALAKQNGITMRRLADTMHNYPSWTLGARRAADQWYIQNTPVGLLRVLGRLRGLRGTVPDVDPDEVV
ncbi:MAG: FAD-dependent oxidoreductase [Myxococcota bacterium]